MEKKVTVRENFESVLKVLEDGGHTDLAEFIQGRIKLLDKKKSSSSDAREKENATLCAKLVQVFEDDQLAVTLTDFSARYHELTGELLSPQKIRSVLKPALEGGTIVNTKKGKTSLYHPASVVVEVEKKED